VLPDLLFEGINSVNKKRATGSGWLSGFEPARFHGFTSEVTPAYGIFFIFNIFKGNKQLMCCAKKRSALSPELQRIAPKTGFEPATRSNTNLRHLKPLIHTEKRVLLKRVTGNK